MKQSQLEILSTLMQALAADSAEPAAAPALLTRGEVAARLKVSTRTVSRLVKSGDLTPVRLGRRCVRFDSRAVESLLNTKQPDSRSSRAHGSTVNNA